MRRIANGEFPPGSHLPPEPDLMAQFGVSRGVIREAVRALEEKGVLSAKAGRGTTVCGRTQWSPFDPLVTGVRLEVEPSPKLFSDLAEIRMALEEQLAKSAALNATNDLLSEMAALLTEMDSPDISAEDFTERDLRFHQLIADASGNEVGRGFLMMMAPSLRAMRQLTNQVPDAFDSGRFFHRRVYERLANRDPAGAGRIMRDHLEWSHEHLIKHLYQRP